MERYTWLDFSIIIIIVLIIYYGFVFYKYYYPYLNYSKVDKPEDKPIDSQSSNNTENVLLDDNPFISVFETKKTTHVEDQLDVVENSQEISSSTNEENTNKEVIAENIKESKEITTNENELNKNIKNINKLNNFNKFDDNYDGEEIDLTEVIEDIDLDYLDQYVTNGMEEEDSVDANIYLHTDIPAISINKFENKKEDNRDKDEPTLFDFNN